MITILSGSSRTHSNTERVAKAVKRLSIVHGIQESDIFMPDFTQYDIPFYNQGSVLKNSLSTFQESVYEGMKNSKLIIFLSPEYNWFPSAEIINLINHFGSREYSECWEGKIFAICGISSGRGGRIPAVQLSYVINKLINVMDFHSIVSAKIFESQFTPKVLDANGESMGSAEYDAGLEKFVQYNVNLANKLQNSLSAE